MLLLLACAAPTVELDLWEGPNHLLPLFLESGEEVAWSFSRMHGTLARLDLETATLETTWALPDFPPAPGRIVPVPEGVWVLWSDHAVLFSPDGEELDRIDRAVLDIRGDRVAVKQGILVGDALTPTDAPPLLLFEDDVALLDDGTVLGPEGVICQAPFASRRASWDGESVYVVKGSQVGRCGGATFDANEPKSALVVGEELWVLDRIGEPDPNVALVRVLDPDTMTELRRFESGKNSGYGFWDGARLWVNSEGTSEVLVLEDERVQHRITVGVHVESVAGEVVSGRLSGRLWNTAGVERPLRWPVAPLLHDGTLYVVSQLDMELVLLDPDTLEVLERRDLGVGANPTLTLSDLVWWEDALWVTDGARDQVLRVEDGLAIPLGQPLDQDASGRLELVPGEGALFVVRARDGRVHRIEGEAVTGSAQVDLPVKTRMQLGAYEDGILWVGGVGLDADTLEIVEERGWDFTIGDGVSWSDGLVIDGETVWTQEGEELPELTRVGDKIYVTDIQDAAVRTFER